MESLHVYESSSDDESARSAKLDLTESTERSSRSNRKRIYDDAENNTGGSGSDFFAINESNSEEENAVSASKVQRRTIQAHNSVDTPVSEFWCNDDVFTDWHHKHQIWSPTEHMSEGNSNIHNGVVSASHSASTSCETRRNDDKTLANQCVVASTCRNIYATSSKVNYYLTSAIKAKCKGCYPQRKTADVNSDSGVINRIKWSAANSSHLLASASASSVVRIWRCLDASTKPISCVQTLTCHTKAVRDISWTHCGRRIASCGYDKKAVISDVETGQRLVEAQHEDFVTCLQFHPVEHNSFLTGSKEALFCWDRRNTCRPAIIFKYKDRMGQVQDAIFNRGGSEIFTCNDLVSRDSCDRNVMAWDFRKGVVVSNQMYHERFACTSLKLHPKGHEFYAQSQGNNVVVFSTTRPYKMSKSRRYEAHKVSSYAIGVDVSPTGEFLISGSADGKAVIYDVQRTRKIEQLRLGDNCVCNDVAWHSVVPGTVAVATWDGRLTVWE